MGTVPLVASVVIHGGFTLPNKDRTPTTARCATIFPDSTHDFLIESVHALGGSFHVGNDDFMMHQPNFTATFVERDNETFGYG